MTPAVVVGLNLNGLGTVRSLGRVGIPVVALAGGNRGNRNPCEFTRFCKVVRVPNMASDEEALVESLERVGRSLPSRAVVFPAGDLYLLAISRNRDRLLEYFHFPFPDHERILNICDKGRFYRIALREGMPINRTVFPRCEADAREAATQLRFPCVMKPSQATPEWRRRGWKVIPLNNPQELLEWFQRAFPVHSDLVIQEVTPGPDSSLHFSLTYLNRDRRPLAMFTGLKIRQNPPRFGISSVAESRWIPEVAKLTEEILQRLDYWGYASIEFKKHPESGQYFMTEVTGRTWYPHYLSTGCGINLPHIIYRDLVLGESPKGVTGFREGVRWIDEEGDMRSAYQYWREGSLSLLDWLRSYRRPRIWGLAARDDPRPFLVFVAQHSRRGLMVVARMVLGRPVRFVKRLLSKMRAANT